MVKKSIIILFFDKISKIYGIWDLFGIQFKRISRICRIYIITEIMRRDF